MFTGLVEEMGSVLAIESTPNGIRLKVKCSKVIENSRIGDSIATNGVCLTAVEIGKNYFSADVMNETVRRTGLKNLKIGNKVNLEKSLTLQTPLGGHLVTGDVDCEGLIINLINDGFAKIYKIELPKEYMKFIVEKGRVAIDGASLTIATVEETSFTVSIIPHTQNMIVLGNKKSGDKVNIETDLIGKFVEKILLSKDSKENGSISSITGNFLLQNVFI
ncbi:MAG: riboflavin synthase [Cetobacterium sp.]